MAKRIVLVSYAARRWRDHLRQTVFKIPGELRRSCALCLRDQIAIVVIDVACSAGARQPIERLIVIRRTLMRRRAIADGVVCIRFSGCAGVRC